MGGAVAMMVLVTVAAGCGHTAGVSPEIEDRRPCDDFEEVAFLTRREPGAVAIDRQVTGGHCSTPWTRVSLVGRILLPPPPAPACPVGERAFRGWDGGAEAEKVELSRSLAPEALIGIREELGRFVRSDIVFAFVLGCSGRGRADFVFVGGDRTALYVHDRLVGTDPRFVPGS